jgi:hypothetical protein
MTPADRFAETVTGKRRVTITELGRIRHHWPEAMRRVVEVGAAHPDAQRRFLGLWQRVPWGPVRQWVGDDELFVTALRVLLPSYDGPAIKLFRGQLADEPVGLSWTRSYLVALKFALYGAENADANNLSKARIPARAGGVVLSSLVHSRAIICAPCLLGHREGEYIVDPRSLRKIIEPAPRM